MSSDDGSDMAANAWPGFVDILSAVVIMFVFFVLITAAVLYFYTITYKAKVEGQSVAALVEIADKNATVKVEELERKNKKLREQIEAIQANLVPASGSTEADTLIVAQSFSAQKTEQSLIVSTDDRTLVLFHDAGSITVDDTSRGKIATFIEQIRQAYGTDNLEILLTSPKISSASTQNRAKRLAVARMLNVRNSLLDSTANRENIQLKVVDSEQIEGSGDWTKLQINILEIN